MTTSKKTTAVLGLFVALKDDGRDKLIRTGTVFHTEKGKTMINIESTPTRTGDWDGRSYLMMKLDNSDISDIFPETVSKSSGSVLPVFEAKAVFETVEGRGTKTHYPTCGVGFRGRVREDGSVKSVVFTLDRLPVGDTGNWDGFTYVGFPLDKPASKPKSGASSKKDEIDTATSE